MVCVNVCLLPDKEFDSIVRKYESSIYKKLSNQFLNCKNQPHLSLYQLNVEQENIEKIIQELSAFLKNHHFPEFKMDREIKKVGKNIFWNASSYHPSFIDSLFYLYERISILKSKTLLPSIQIQNLSHHQKMLVEKYGVFWGTPETFNPHFTIAYETLFDAFLRIDQDHFFLPNELCIAEIGFYGNIEKTIWTTNIRNVS